MNLKINKLKIQNFRNIDNFEINFKNDVTEILAENGKGKTNTLSAIMWCLFGKNIYEAKSFPISPIVDGVERNDLKTNVTLYVNDNYIISRNYYKRTTTLQTGYLIDGIEQLVDTTQANYKKEFADKFVDEETYKSLSNINYIPSLNWKDLKKLIFDLIGGISDEEVLLNDDFSLIEEQIRLMGINSTQEALKSSDSALNEKIKAKETECQTLINTKNKYVAENSDFKDLKLRKETLEKQIKENNLKVEENNKIIAQNQKKENLIASKKQEISMNIIKQDSLINSIDLLQKQYNLLATDGDVIKQKEINNIQYEIDTLIDRMSSLNEQNKEYVVEKDNLKVKGLELKNKEVKVEKDTCSSCGQKLPQELIDKTLQNLKNEQIEQLERIKQQYDDIKKIIEINQKEIEEKNLIVLDLKKQLEKIKNTPITIESENDKQKEIRVLREQHEIELKQIQENTLKLQEELKEIESIEIQKIRELVDVTEIIEELNSINVKLASTTTLEKINEDIELANEELSKLKNDKNIVKNKMLEVTKFNNVKAELLRNKAKSNFKIVDFKTKEYTQDGTEVETFKICVDGIDYQELNTGMKTLISIDLITGIQKLKDIYVPIIIDNAENVTSEIKVENTQLIIARAIKGIEGIEVK